MMVICKLPISVLFLQKRNKEEWGGWKTWRESMRGGTIGTGFRRGEGSLLTEGLNKDERSHRV